jgi:hypothetical protein
VHTAKRVTMADFAAMIQRGFQETAQQTEVDAQFGAVTQRLDHTEQRFLTDHTPRIEHVEVERVI